MKKLLLIIFIFSGLLRAQTPVDSLNVAPNPFQKRTCAFYSFSQNDTVSLLIYDNIGQNILSIKTDIILTSGYYQDSIIMDTYPNGIYFTHLKLGKRKTIVEKIIKTTCTSPLSVFASNSAISCSGACDATATVTASGNAPYSYTWSPTGANTAIINNICAGTYTIDAIDFNGCVGSTALIVLNPSNPCVGVEEYFFRNEVSIYPNPVKETLFIKTEKCLGRNLEIEIVNVIGQIVLRSKPSKEVDVSNLPKGYYTLKIVNANKDEFHSKFIKE